jgi:hypothetical protein
MDIVNEMQIIHRYLNIPLNNESAAHKVKLIINETVVKELSVQLASEQVDFWAYVDMDKYKGQSLKIEVEVSDPALVNGIILSHFIAGKEELYHERHRPQFHFTPQRGWMGSPKGTEYIEGRWHVFYEHNPFGKNSVNPTMGCAVSQDLIHWSESNTAYAVGGNEKQPEFDNRHLYELQVEGKPDCKRWVQLADNGHYAIGNFNGTDFIPDGPHGEIWHGSSVPSFTYAQTLEGHCIQIGISKDIDHEEMPFSQQLLMPSELKLIACAEGIQLAASPVKEMENLRVWKRSWSDRELMNNQIFSEPLSFRIGPGEWPDIRILPAEGLPDDLGGDLLEAIIDIQVNETQALEIRLCGIPIMVDLDKRILTCEENSAPLLLNDSGTMRLHLLLDRSSLEIFTCEGRVALFTGVQLTDLAPGIVISCLKGRAKVSEVTVFGLRSIWPTSEEAALINDANRDSIVLYQSENYTVYSNKIEDRVYGEPPAYVPDRNTIVSPTRAVEEFVWRRTPWGDMTRIIDRGNIWRPKYNESKYPELSTGYNTIDAAYGLALDIFYRCSLDEFARVGEKGLWSAGQFQGPGEGFGVWVRDTAHIAIRMGNLLDPEGARRSLLFTTIGGFDNGVDGTAMPIVGIWDYYLATGDLTLIKDTWDNLKSRIARLDAGFDPEIGLIAADQSTSNDAFPEPECGGFSLSTEIYFMESFRAMSRMGALMGEDPGQINDWAEMGELLLTNIQEKYWNESAGFFTSGPIGSESFGQHYWESSGQEIALWPRFGIASRAQRSKILDRLPEVAMNEFGVNVFPYRNETNHFCNAAWVAWTAGIAAAAGREGKLDLLMQLIAQQVRNSVMNKTFFEAIDYQTGRAWRWPGQLWHATGFISYFYLGILGMEYDEQGLTLKPAIPEQLANLQVANFRYRNCVLDISATGWGSACLMKLDGDEVELIPTHLEGRHKIELLMQG